MNSHQLLSASEVALALPNLRGWVLEEDGLAIEREFQFNDFQEAFAFMTQVAQIAESMDHHPAWSNVYSKLHMRLYTHDLGGVSQKDLDLAQAVQELL